MEMPSKELNAYDLITFDRLLRHYGPEVLQFYCEHPPQLLRDLPLAIDRRRLQSRLNDEAVRAKLEGPLKTKLINTEEVEETKTLERVKICVEDDGEVV